MAANFIHLNIHSEYSIVDGIVRIDALMEHCVKQQMMAVAITDDSNWFGVIKFYTAALAAGIKPIIGVNVWLHNPSYPAQPYRLILLAQTQVGYQNIVQLISYAYLHGQQHGRPLVQWQWLVTFAAGVIVLLGTESEIGRALVEHNHQQASSLLTQWVAVFQDRLYLELTRIGRAGEEDYIQQVLALAASYQVPVVATNAVCFINQDDFDAHEARVCIHGGYVLADTKRPRRYTKQQYLRSSAEMGALFADIPSALVNTVEIAKRCNVDIHLGTSFLPVFPVDGLSIEEYFIKQAQQGLAKRLRSLEVEPKVYEERLAYEIQVITQMGFASYFLIVADFIAWAKQNEIPVGPGRGSGAGSLVAYALEITNIDPILHELLFERFLNPERVSLPDFDIDFCMDGRDRVIEYVIQRYGKDKVAQIITYGTMAARAVVRDVGRVLGYSYGFVDKIAKLIPFELGIDLQRALQEEALLQEMYVNDEDVKTLIDLALKLEGLTRNAGKHAGGVVIAPSALTDFMPLYCEASGSSVVTQFAKDDVEAVGLVKFDFLGLRTLTIIHRALQLIGDPKLDINTISLADSATFELLQSCNTTAVFQLESRGMKDLIKRLQPDCFNDIVALVALFRPGPLQSGMVDDFIDCKQQRKEVTYAHPKLASILGATYGVILYQEQVMQIAQSLAGYSLGEADLLRRAMGKKKPEEMAKQRTIFLTGAQANGVDKHLANHIFDLMEKFAGYGFNKSHSVAYALLAYQTAWLKAHYPAEFMAAVLSADMDNTDKVVLFLRDCKNLGLNILPPDINSSNYQFTPVTSTEIVYGLGAIKGVGQSAIESILAGRKEPFSDLFALCRSVDSRKINKRVLESLIYAGALDKLGPNRASMLATLPLALQGAAQHTKDSAVGQLDLFADFHEETLAYVTVPELPLAEKLKTEKSVLGFYLSGHPMEQFVPELTKMQITPLDQIKAADNKKLLAGLVNNVRVLHTKNNSRLAIITLTDHTGSIEITAFAEVYNEARNSLIIDQLLIVEGEVSVDNYTHNLRMRAVRIFSLDEARNVLAKALVIKVTADVMIAKLRTILAEHPGKCPVYLAYTNKELQVQLLLGNPWQVQLSTALLTQLRTLFDEQAVTIIYQ